VLESADELGIGVPDDLAVVGYDDIEIARYAGLTTIAQPLEESGAVGAHLLLAALDGGEVPGRQLPVRLVVRSTTAGCTDRSREAHMDGKRVRS
jgi:LacI family transcriptional regulator